MRWDDLHAQQPRLGAVADDRLLGPGVVLVATIRRDGTPRLSPVEPFVLDGDLWLSMLLGSLKATDLHRDPRVLVHSVVTGPNGEDGELKLRGTAVAADDPDTQQRYADAVAAALPWSPEVGRFHLFRVDVETSRTSVTTTTPATSTWSAGRPAPRPFAEGPRRPPLGDPELARRTSLELTARSSVALRAVDQLADDVQVPVVAGVLLDQVLKDPAERDLPPVAHPLDRHLVEVEVVNSSSCRPRHLGVVVERDRQRLVEPVGELLLCVLVPPGHLERLAEQSGRGSTTTPPSAGG